VHIEPAEYVFVHAALFQALVALEEVAVSAIFAASNIPAASVANFSALVVAEEVVAEAAAFAVFVPFAFVAPFLLVLLAVEIQLAALAANVDGVMQVAPSIGAPSITWCRFEIAIAQAESRALTSEISARCRLDS
jgi:hypothetical protein